MSKGSCCDGRIKVVRWGPIDADWGTVKALQPTHELTLPTEKRTAVAAHNRADGFDEE
jgi:hypothetical protein